MDDAMDSKNLVGLEGASKMDDLAEDVLNGDTSQEKGTYEKPREIGSDGKQKVKELAQIRAFCEENEIYIGNLRQDVEKDSVVTRLQKLFSTAGVNVTNEQFSELQNGPKRTKNLIAVLRNGEEAKHLINRFDGVEDREIVCEKRALKVCLKKDKPMRKRKRRKRKISSKYRGIEANVDAEEDSNHLGNILQSVETDNDIAVRDYRNVAEEDGLVSHYEEDAHCWIRELNSEKQTDQDFEGSNAEDLKTDGIADLPSGLQISRFSEVPMDRQGNREGSGTMSEKARTLVMGEALKNEDRRTEYKRGGGKYPRNHLVADVRRYCCAFLNSEGGKLFIGIADNGQVHGIQCNRKQEDTCRQLIDGVIARFQPPVFPEMYSVSFIPVLPHHGYDVTLQNEESLKVLEIDIKRPARRDGCLFETDRGEVFIRRDGSVQGPLKASQIIDWCKRYNNLEQDSRVQKPEAMGVTEGKDHRYINDISSLKMNPNANVGGTVSVQQTASVTDKILDLHSLSRLGEIEASIRDRQHFIEKEIATMRGHYEAREKELQDELERSRYEGPKKKKKRKSKKAICTIL